MEHLYDLPYLQRHPLARPEGAAPEPSTGNAGQRLRKELLAAIEDLSPGAGVPFRALPARLYNLLHLRYVEGMTVQEAARELAISTRQTYRDLRRGEESVAAILWGQQASSSPPEPTASRLSSVEAEMARLEPHVRPVDIRSLVQQALNAVEQLAKQHSISFAGNISSQPVIVSTDPVMAHQILVNTFSYAIQHAQPGALGLTLKINEAGPCLALRYTPQTGPVGETALNPVVARLTERLGWQVKQDVQSENLHLITLYMTGHGPTVLVVDDNEGLVELLERYLTGHACRVTAATNGPEGLQLAQELLPEAVILDVMMPEMDGWEFLQRLRAGSQTAAIPVIICSIFNDPELAYSLGASLVLPKPVSRNNILAALHQLGVLPANE